MNDREYVDWPVLLNMLTDGRLVSAHAYSRDYRKVGYAELEKTGGTWAEVVEFVFVDKTICVEAFGDGSYPCEMQPYVQTEEVVK